MASRTADPIEVAQKFHAAALGSGDWSDALSALADATGSRSGELLGLGGARAPTFYCRNALPTEFAADFLAADGYNPAVNSRVRRAMATGELVVLDESHFTTAQDMERHPAYGEVIRALDIPFICLTNLVKDDRLLIGLSVVRGASQGPISSAQRLLFERVAPHVRSAVRLHMELERQGISLITSTLDSVSACAFVCDANARVRALTPSAEALVADTEWLQLKNGALFAPTHEETQILEKSVKAAAVAGLAGLPPPQAFVVKDRRGRALPLEASVLVPPHSFRFHAAALLVARPPTDTERRASTLGRLLFDLSPKEASVAAKLVAGHSVKEIAEREGISVATARVHLRNIFVKMNVSRQVEIVAKLASQL